MSNRVDSNDGTPKESDLPYLLYRMEEPLYYPKGDNPKEQRFFELSPDYLSDDLKCIAQQVLSRPSEQDEVGRRVFLGDIEEDLMKISLDQVKVLKRNVQFSPFIPLHRKAASHLINIFLSLKSVNDFIKFAGFCRDKVNCQLFVYAYAIALSHREDTKNVRVPSAAEVFPARFVQNEVVASSRKNANLFENPKDRAPVEIPSNATGNDGDIEHRMAYWREDVGVNLHHWHWHVLYPFGGPDAIVRKDRRGELFYYFHHHILARYNVERLCNKLDLTKRLMNWDEPIEEAYYPMLSSDIAGKEWPSRPKNMKLCNLNRADNDVTFDIEDLKRYRERIFDAINKKTVIAANGTQISIDNDQGIDILGNIVEASSLSVNPNYYGDLHNMGHMAISFIDDPQNKYHQSPGVMSEVATAMRDPVFYRWHAFINHIFTEHKYSLRPYDVKDLTFEDVQVTNVGLCSYETKDTCRQEKNTLHTCMSQSDINVTRGLDFAPRGPVLVRVIHLNHDEFKYNIECVNKSAKELMGTIRIFLLPTNGFGNYKLKMKHQCRLAIEMDRFALPLKPGVNKITRQSTMSTVTIPFEQIFRDLDTKRQWNSQQEADKFNFCGCGWPHNLLVPRGTNTGYPMTLFVMITDNNLDRANPIEPINVNECKTAEVTCGLRNKKYPDKRPMGFPFDRLPRDAEFIEDFLTPNMAIRPITIFHSKVQKKGRLLSNATPKKLRMANTNSGN